MSIELSEALQEISYKLDRLEARVRRVEEAVGSLIDRGRELEGFRELELRLRNLLEVVRNIEDLSVQLRELNEKLGVILVETAALRDYLRESLRELRQRDDQLYEIMLEKCKG